MTPRGRHARAPQRSPRRQLALAVAAVAVAVGVAIVVWGTSRDGSSPSARPPATPSTGAPASGSAEPTTTATTQPAATTTVDPGTLPQTSVKPTADDALFQQDARLLWQAIVTDDPSVAGPTFFPRTAYRQVKAISDPDHDYDTRLLADFAQDIHAYHVRLGTDGASARFLELSVPEAAAQWIKPGVEYNKGSYWRVYGSQLRYEVGGVTHSLPVASLISWRGEWYVVHLASIR